MQKYLRNKFCHEIGLSVYERFAVAAAVVVTAVAVVVVVFLSRILMSEVRFSVNGRILSQISFFWFEIVFFTNIPSLGTPMYFAGDIAKKIKTANFIW